MSTPTKFIQVLLFNSFGKPYESAYVREASRHEGKKQSSDLGSYVSRVFYGQQ